MTPRPANIGSSPHKGIAYTLIASALFGINGAVAADLLVQIPAGNVAQLRSVLAALVIGAIAYRRGLAHSRGQLWTLAALGLTLALVTVSFFLAISRLGVGPGVTIQFTGPILVLGWQRLVEKRKVSSLAWTAAAIAFVGVGLVSGIGGARRLDLGGLLAAGVAAITFAAYILLSSRLGRNLPTLTIAAYGFGFSAIFLLLAFPLLLPPIQPLLLGEFGWLVVLGTVVPFLLEVEAVRVLDPGLVGVIATLEPVVAAAAAWIGLDQGLSGAQIAGGLLVVGAVAVIERLTSLPYTPSTQ